MNDHLYGNGLVVIYAKYDKLVFVNAYLVIKHGHGALHELRVARHAQAVHQLLHLLLLLANRLRISLGGSVLELIRVRILCSNYATLLTKLARWTGKLMGRIDSW